MADYSLSALLGGLAAGGRRLYDRLIPQFRLSEEGIADYQAATRDLVAAGDEEGLRGYGLDPHEMGLGGFGLAKEPSSEDWWRIPFGVMESGVSFGAMAMEDIGREAEEYMGEDIARYYEDVRALEGARRPDYRRERGKGLPTDEPITRSTWGMTPESVAEYQEQTTPTLSGIMDKEGRVYSPLDTPPSPDLTGTGAAGTSFGDVALSNIQASIRAGLDPNYQVEQPDFDSMSDEQEKAWIEANRGWASIEAAGEVGAALALEFALEPEILSKFSVGAARRKLLRATEKAAGAIKGRASKATRTANMKEVFALRKKAEAAASTINRLDAQLGTLAVPGMTESSAQAIESAADVYERRTEAGEPLLHPEFVRPLATAVVSTGMALGAFGDARSEAARLGRRLKEIGTTPADIQAQEVTEDLPGPVFTKQAREKEALEGRRMQRQAQEVAQAQEAAAEASRAAQRAQQAPTIAPDPARVREIMDDGLSEEEAVQIAITEAVQESWESPQDRQAYLQANGWQVVEGTPHRTTGKPLQILIDPEGRAVHVGESTESAWTTAGIKFADTQRRHIDVVRLGFLSQADMAAAQGTAQEVAAGAAQAKESIQERDREEAQAQITALEDLGWSVTEAQYLLTEDPENAQFFVERGIPKDRVPRAGDFVKDFGYLDKTPSPRALVSDMSGRSDLVRTWMEKEKKRQEGHMELLAGAYPFRESDLAAPNTAYENLQGRIAEYESTMAQLETAKAAGQDVGRDATSAMLKAHGHSDTSVRLALDTADTHGIDLGEGIEFIGEGEYSDVWRIGTATKGAWKGHDLVLRVNESGRPKAALVRDKHWMMPTIETRVGPSKSKLYGGKALEEGGGTYREVYDIIPETLEPGDVGKSDEQYRKDRIALQKEVMSDPEFEQLTSGVDADFNWHNSRYIEDPGGWDVVETATGKTQDRHETSEKAHEARAEAGKGYEVVPRKEGPRLIVSDFGAIFPQKGGTVARDTKKTGAAGSIEALEKLGWSPVAATRMSDFDKRRVIQRGITPDKAPESLKARAIPPSEALSKQFSKAKGHNDQVPSYIQRVADTHGIELTGRLLANIGVQEGTPGAFHDVYRLGAATKGKWKDQDLVIRIGKTPAHQTEPLTIDDPRGTDFVKDKPWMVDVIDTITMPSVGKALTPDEIRELNFLGEVRQDLSQKETERLSELREQAGRTGDKTYDIMPETFTAEDVGRTEEQFRRDFAELQHEIGFDPDIQSGKLLSMDIAGKGVNTRYALQPDGTHKLVVSDLGGVIPAKGSVARDEKLPITPQYASVEEAAKARKKAEVVARNEVRPAKRKEAAGPRRGALQKILARMGLDERKVVKNRYVELVKGATENFKKQGWTSIVDFRVDPNSPYSSLAYALRILRAPFEVTHMIGVKDGRVVIHQAFTSGEVNRVDRSSPEYKGAERQMAEAHDRGEIDEWITAHNHPGGEPRPSPDDIEEVSSRIAAMDRRGYRGEVITDYREYGYIMPPTTPAAEVAARPWSPSVGSQYNFARGAAVRDTESGYRRFDTEIQRKLAPDDPLFVGEKTGLNDVRNMTEVVAYHKKNTEGLDVATLFYTSNVGVVRGVQLISIDNLRDASWIRRHVEESKARIGGGFVTLMHEPVGADSRSQYEDVARGLMVDNTVLDAVAVDEKMRSTPIFLEGAARKPAAPAKAAAEVRLEARQERLSAEKREEVLDEARDIVKNPDRHALDERRPEEFGGRSSAAFREAGKYIERLDDVDPFTWKVSKAEWAEAERLGGIIDKGEAQYEYLDGAAYEAGKKRYEDAQKRWDVLFDKAEAAKDTALELMQKEVVAAARTFITGQGRGAAQEKVPLAERVSTPSDKPFYSHLRNVVDKIKQKAGSARDFLKYLTSPKHGVKAEELKWTGLGQFLRARAGKVTKQEMQDFLDANDVELEEVVKGKQAGPGWGFDKEIVQPGGEPKFATWQLPGGKEGSYREVLFKLKKGAAVFTEPHFDEEGIVAHVRFNERTGPKGERILFVEEAQSAWHQKAKAARGNEIKRLMKEKGLTKDEASKRVPAEFGYGLGPEQMAAHKAEGEAIFAEAKKLGIKRDEVSTITLRTANREDLARRYASWSMAATKTGLSIPAAPFGGATGSPWHEMVMRRMTRWAAENGFDKVSWINGEETAKRYDLSKRLSRVLLEDNTSGGATLARMEGPFEAGMFKAYDLDGKEVISQHVRSRAEVEGLIGKEPTGRLFAAKATQERSAGLGVRAREVSGLDLKIGGEWAENLYDKMIPSFMKRFGKQWGAEVGRAEFKGPKEAREQRWEELTEQQQAAMGPEDLDVDVSKTTRSFQSLDITPAMRRSVVEKGVSMFQEKKPLSERQAKPRPGDKDFTLDGSDFFARDPAQELDESAEVGPSKPQAEDLVEGDYYDFAAPNVETVLEGGKEVGLPGPGDMIRVGKKFYLADPNDQQIIAGPFVTQDAAKARSRQLADERKAAKERLDKLFPGAEQVKLSIEERGRRRRVQAKMREEAKGRMRPDQGPPIRPRVAPEHGPPGPFQITQEMLDEATEVYDAMETPELMKIRPKAKEALKNLGVNFRTELQSLPREMAIEQLVWAKVLQDNKQLARALKDKSHTQRWLMAKRAFKGDSRSALLAKMRPVKSEDSMITYLASQEAAAERADIEANYLANKTEANKQAWVEAVEKSVGYEMFHLNKKSELARAMNALNFLKRMDLDPDLSWIGRFRRSMKMQGVPEAAIKDMATAIEVGDLKRFEDLYRAILKPGILQKIVWMRNAGLVEGPATQFVNITSNGVFRGFLDFEKAIMATAIESVMAPWQGRKRERTFSEIGAMWAGYKWAVGWGTKADEGPGAAGHLWGQLIDIGSALGRSAVLLEPKRVRKQKSQLISRESKAEFAVAPVGARTEAVFGAGYRTLAAFDDFFKAVSAGPELWRRRYRKALSEPMKVKKRLRSGKTITVDRARTHEEALGAASEDIAAMSDLMVGKGVTEEAMERFGPDLEAVKKMADTDTFQEKLSPGLQKVQTAIRGSLFGSLLVPFFRTPTNIFKQAYIRSPPALLGLMLTKRGRALPRIEKTEALARAITGSLLGSSIAVLAYMSMDDEDNEGFAISGGGPTNWKQRANKIESGWAPYSIRFTKDGRWYDYSRLEPISTTIGLAADLAEAVHKEGGPGGMAEKFETEKERSEMIAELSNRLTYSLSENLFNKTFLMGLSGFFEATRPGAGNKMKSWLSSMETSFIPLSGATRALTRTIDPVFRKSSPWDVIMIAGKIPFFTTAIQSAIPGWSLSLPPRTTAGGEERRRRPPGVAAALSPVSVRASKPEAAAETEFDRLGYVPAAITDTMSRGSVKYHITQREQDQMNAARRESIRRIAAQLKTPQYHAMPDDEKDQPAYDDARARRRGETRPPTKRSTLQKIIQNNEGPFRAKVLDWAEYREFLKRQRLRQAS